MDVGRMRHADLRDPFWARGQTLLLILIILSLLAWELALRARILNPHHYAAPTAALRLLGNDLVHPVGDGDVNLSRPLATHVLITVFRWLRGFAVAVILGVLLGFVIASSKRAYHVGLPVVNFLRALPSAAIWPIAALATGFSSKAQTIVIVFGSVWPVLLNTVNGLRGLQQELLDSLQFMHLHKWQRTWILLQLAAPAIFTGIEIACSVAFLLSVTVEMLWPSEGGIGWYLSWFQNQGDPTPLFAGVLLTAFVGWLLNTAVQRIRRTLLFWEIDGDDAREILRRFVSGFSVDTARKRAAAEIRDHRIVRILHAEAVTEAIQKEFGGARLRVRKSTRPWFEPTLLSRIIDPDSTAHLRQRDVVIEAPIAGTFHPVLFAQSWINEARLSVKSQVALSEGQLTIGQIVRTFEGGFSSDDLAFRSVISEDMGRLLQQPGAVRAIERQRVIRIDDIPAILIHEYYPAILA